MVAEENASRVARGRNSTKNDAESMAAERKDKAPDKRKEQALAPEWLLRKNCRRFAAMR